MGIVPGAVLSQNGVYNMYTFTKEEKHAVTAAMQNSIQKLYAQLEATKKVVNSIKWAKLTFAPTHERTGLSNKTGVYKIIHIPTGNVMYIGQGNVLRRRSIHNVIFNNNGQPVVYKDANGNVTSSADSPAGRKMFAHDPNINNWEFHVCTAPKHISQLLEEQLQNLYQPPFCDPKMSGLS